MAESVTISAKITIDQKKDLAKKAQASGMSINEYIKARIFDDVDNRQDTQFISDMEKRNYLTICKTYALVQNLSLNSVQDPKIIQELEQFAVDNLKERGLLPSDHPLMVK